MIKPEAVFLPGLLALGSVVAIRTLNFKSRQVEVEPAALDEVDEQAAAVRLADAIKIKTISFHEQKAPDAEAFPAFHKYLEEAFPLVHRTLERETVADYSLLYRWPGADPALKPCLFMAHIDVVPIERGTEEEWTHPPFSGEIADGFIWGRGAMDIKCGLTGVLEAVENLLKAGFTPRRTVYLSFGHDEELGGPVGAVSAVKLLQSRDVRLEYVLDEGGSILSGFFPVDKPVAFVGVCEKGYLSLELSAQGEPGHASMPPRQTAVGIVSSAIHKLERNQFPARLSGMKRTFDYLGPEMPLGMRILFANSWLFAPLILKKLEAKRETNAAVRTTIAPTMMEGSSKDNVLPARAAAVVNFRLLQGDTIDGVMARVRKIVNDSRIKIEVLGWNRNEPSPVSEVDTEAYRRLEKTIRQAFPGVITAPATMLGATDSRHFVKICDSVFRFIPMRIEPEDVPRAHGTNERLAVENYAEIVRFYMLMIRNS